MERKDISAHVALHVDTGGERREGEGRLVADVETDATHVLSELGLDADLQQVILEEHAVVFANEPGENTNERRDAPCQRAALNSTLV